MRCLLAVGIGLALASGGAPAASLSLFHNNDGESKLLGSAGFGGVASFAATLAAARAEAAHAGRDVLTISAGDNFLAGLAFNASLNSGALGARRYYDALALAAIAYDAIAIGNHDFDFGPEVLADFIRYYRAHGGTAPFLSANLDLRDVASLETLETAGMIAASAIVARGAERYGIVGATSEDLRTISRPGRVIVNDVAEAVLAEVAVLQQAGVNKIILASHLQGIEAEATLIPQLRGVDIVIAGGGDELLINRSDAFTDTLDGVNDEPDDGIELRLDAYPITWVRDADGKPVPLVTTVGEYRYVGRLNVEFDRDGEVTSAAGDPLIVNPRAAGASQAGGVIAEVVQSLAGAQAALAKTVIGTTEAALNGRRGAVTGSDGKLTIIVPGVRNSETNLGDLVADALLWQARQARGSGLTGDRVIAFTNGGAIRYDSIIGPGAISAKDTVDILPFGVHVSVINGVTATALKDMLENGVSRVRHNDGRFPQIGGFRFVWDPRRPPARFATPTHTMAALAKPGTRIRRIEFADGTTIYDAETGERYAGTIDLVTHGFVAAGGDGYDFTGNNTAAGTPALRRTNLPFSMQQALVNYIAQGLGGKVRAAAYPAAGLGRIIASGEQPAAGKRQGPAQ